MGKILKTIIAVSGTADVGKSMTLTRLGRQLLTNGGITIEDLTPNEYRAVFEYAGATVGVQTYGDSDQVVREGLDIFLEEKCQVIAMACKRYGATALRIENFARQNDFRVIWTSPYQVWDNSITVDVIKSTSARHLRFMIDEIIDGTL